MKLYDLNFMIQDVIVELEPEEVTESVCQAAIPEEAQEMVKPCTVLGLAVGMPYGFQLYTDEQWNDLKRRVHTFPSIMQRHMRPFFATAMLLDADDEASGFPKMLQIPASIAGYARMEDWPAAEDGAMKALLIQTDDGRIYVLRADGKDEFMETMLQQ